MPLDLSGTLVVGISSTALFDLEGADRLFQELREEDPDEAIERYRKYMQKREDEPLPGGPYEDFLKALAEMQDRLPSRVEYSPVHLALVTSRDSSAELRVIKTLREWGVYVDLAFFLGGVDKGPVLEAFNPHIFFDDRDVYVESASERVPTGKVLYCSDSTLRALQAERDEGSDREEASA